jgi:hypothetical protein
MKNCTRHKKTSLDQASFGVVLKWFYAEPYKAQKHKPGPSFIWGLFKNGSMQNCARPKKTSLDQALFGVV